MRAIAHLASPMSGYYINVSDNVKRAPVSWIGRREDPSLLVLVRTPPFFDLEACRNTIRSDTHPVSL